MKPYSSFLVGVDFSPTSGIALRHALRLASGSGGRVRVLHIVDTDVALGLESALPSYPKAIREQLVEDARAAWQAFSAAIPGAAAAEFEAVVDALTPGLVRRARELAAELLVLGAYGDRKPDVGFGTVATSAVRHAHCDVLLVRDSQVQPFRRIVAAVDFSPTSFAALERAAALAATEGAELVVLHVFYAPWRDLHYRAPTMLVEPQMQAKYLALLETRLVEFAAPAVKALAPGRVSHVLEDASSHRTGIPEVVARLTADLAVLGTRGKTNLRDVLLGSTAEKTLRRASSSVLAVRA
ncbi:MAG: universal stress protein [Planctomycetes bacterium]|nr:universal stress protein [Planctomycetota bacterium]